MTLWKIYKKSDDGYEYMIHHKMEGAEKFILYAVTNNKDLLTEFKRVHNMKKFVIREVKDITKEEYASFVNSNRSSLLKKVRIDTQDRKFNKKTIEMVVTELEETIMDEPYVESITDEMFWIRAVPDFDIKLLKKKYKKALNRLYFTNVYMLFKDLYEEAEDYSVPNYEFDQLAIYIDNFRSIL